MNLSADDLASEARETGFGAGPLEKVLRLMSLLDALRSHPYLKTRVVLKGGTALNLFQFELPRLSVDIDLNYVGAVDREAMLAERPKVEQAIQAVCSREDLGIRRMPDEHAGGKWRLTYQAAAGGSGNLELDINFMLRSPLWEPREVACCTVGSYRGLPVRMLDIHELAAGKLAALLSRTASRDLFDSHRILGLPELDFGKLRLGFVVYGGINRKDWRTVLPDDVQVDLDEVQRSLVPMLRRDLAPTRALTGEWSRRLVDECRERLAAVLPLSEGEREFLDRLNDYGEVFPEAIADDPAMQAIIRGQPGLLWKAQNVREHRKTS